MNNQADNNQNQDFSNTNNLYNKQPDQLPFDNTNNIQNQLPFDNNTIQNQLSSDNNNNNQNYNNNQDNSQSKNQNVYVTVSENDKSDNLYKNFQSNQSNQNINNKENYYNNVNENDNKYNYNNVNENDNKYNSNNNSEDNINIFFHSKSIIIKLFLLVLIVIIATTIFYINKSNNLIYEKKLNLFVDTAKDYINITKKTIQKNNNINCTDKQIAKYPLSKIINGELSSISPFGNKLNLEASFVVVQANNNLKTCEYIYSIYITDDSYSLGTKDNPILEKDIEIHNIKKILSDK